jgi:hypothetical protein
MNDKPTKRFEPIEGLFNSVDYSNDIDATIWKFDMVNEPPHYKLQGNMEVIDITEHMGFCLGNVVRYVLRCDTKGSAMEDLKKAQWYLSREIKRRGEK